MGFDLWELLAIYELASFSFPPTYQDLVREAVEKGARILGLRRLAITLEDNGRAVDLGHWGFAGRAPTPEQIRQVGEEALVHAMSRGVKGMVYLEPAHRPSARERRLLKLFARRLEDVIAVKEMERKTRQSERAFRAILNNVQEAVFIFEPGGRVLEINRSVLRLYRLADREGALGRCFWQDYSGPGCPREDVDRWWAEEAEEESLYLEWPARRPADGSTFDAEVYFTKMVFSGREALLATVRDVSERRRREDLLRSTFEHTPIGMYIVSGGKFETVNPQFEQLSGYTLEELVGRDSLSLVFPEDREKVRQEAVRMLKGGEARPYEFRLVTKGGGLRWVEETVASWEHEGRRVTLGSVIDVTEKKRFAERLEYISLHDQLTGLYNRAHFEEQLGRLARPEDFPVSVIMADVNGLKLVNDSLGHHRGDELLVACARILQHTLRRSDVVARVGGDEFVALLPNTDEATGAAIVRRLQAAIEEYNRRHTDLPLSVSFGLATAHTPGESLRQAYRQADDRMYREKLSQGTNARNQIVDALLAALAERDRFAEGHARRLAYWCRLLAERLGLPARQKDDLALLAQVHDIGKVGIPDTVLLKPGLLGEDEWKVIRQHPEKGYRIALATPELAGVADLILKHHERWDGSGYPLGLKEQEIPLECRLLAIVDAFDAMTSDRPYRKAKSVAEAVEEIRRCAGTQFDPDLAALFLEVLSERGWTEVAAEAERGAPAAKSRPQERGQISCASGLQIS
ncbi:MAG: diguanylate cyclase [Clostridia bacterium]|nr:diguanylate cyclase [Clostridia bacterium]MDH7573151.1 diguanylate cyclase [Clostridia bacterium]